MPLTLIGMKADQTNQSPFNVITFPVAMDVSISSDFTPTIKASTDFNGWHDFKISLDSIYVSAYSESCVAYVD
jgi:hypothetical protein